MDDHDVAHLAGVLDGAGRISAGISKENGYAVGYRYKPYVRIHRPENDSAMLGKLDAYAEEYGVRYNLIEKTESVMFRISDPDVIERFLEPLLPWLVTTYEPAIIMLEEVLPALREDKHKTKDGLYELAGYADELREVHHRGRKTKYSQEYFADEWADEFTG